MQCSLWGGMLCWRRLPNADSKFPLGTRAMHRADRVSFYIEKTPGKIAFNPGQGSVRASTACLAHSGYAESGAVAALHWATKRGAPHTLSWPGLAETAPV